MRGRSGRRHQQTNRALGNWRLAPTCWWPVPPSSILKTASPRPFKSCSRVATVSETKTGHSSVLSHLVLGSGTGTHACANRLDSRAFGTGMSACATVKNPLRQDPSSHSDCLLPRVLKRAVKPRRKPVGARATAFTRRAGENVPRPEKPAGTEKEKPARGS